MADAKEHFHASLVYAWHFAKCPGMAERTHHSHSLVSYDRQWLTRMFQRITGGYFTAKTTPALTLDELKQIRLEREAARLIQERKSLEVWTKV